MKNLAYIIEQHGFDIVYQEDTVWISRYTPAGEDWNLYFDKLEDIIEYSENYDPEEDFAMWIEARKRDNTVPGPTELWKDQLWKQETLKDIAKEWTDTNGEKGQ